VEFAPGEGLLVIAELHQAGKPMRPLGQKTFTHSTESRRLTISLTRSYEDDTKTFIGHSVKVQLGEQVFEIPQFEVSAKGYHNGEVLNWFQGGELRKQHQSHKTTDQTALATLLSYCLVHKKAEMGSSIRGLGISSGVSHRVVLNMILVSQLKYLATEPVDGSSVPNSPALVVSNLRGI
jgi:hypothetical protein